MPKPFVQIATVCEKVLAEKDGVLSVIRIVDTFFVGDPGNLPEGLKPGVQISGLVSLKSGDVTGKHDVALKYRKPNGSVSDVGTWPVIFNGGEHGVNLSLNLMVSAADLGLSWFDVYYDGELLTSFPLKLAPQARPEEVSEKH